MSMESIGSDTEAKPATNELQPASSSEVPEAKPAANGSSRLLVQLSFAASLLTLGVLATTAGISFTIIPTLLDSRPAAPRTMWALTLLGFGAMTAAAWWLVGIIRRLPDPEQRPEPDRSQALYGRYLVGVGFALLLDALINVVVFAAIAWTIHTLRSVGPVAGEPSPLAGDTFDGNEAAEMALSAGSEFAPWAAALFGKTADDAAIIGMLLVLSTLVALLGALFFFANALWARMQEAERDPFDRAIFWAGLWFRLGEAVVFNLVFFLLFRLYAPEQYLILPLLSLLVGMFLKSGEQLISGLANRLFAALSQLLPIEKGAGGARKIFELPLKNLPSDPIKREQAMKLIEKAVTNLRGTEQTVVDPVREQLRVMYDCDRITPEEIHQAVRLLGFD
jgi:hypothetical protein